MIFQESIIGNSRCGADQWTSVREARNRANLHNRNLNAMAGLAVNEGLIPQDVYQDFDNVTVERMRSDDGDTFLNDLLPLSRPIAIGKLISKFRQSSDAGNAQTSMSGQIGVNFDQVEYTYDGTLVPIHDTGYSRNWREWSGMNSEGFDALIDDQRESVATLRQRLADTFLSGHTDKDGNLITLDAVSWSGMTADSRVAAIDIGTAGVNFDFTDQAQTPDAIKNAFIQVIDVMRITNNCAKDITIYVSREIRSNFERRFSANYDSKTIEAELMQLMGVAGIKSTNKLTGNTLMGFPIDAMVIRPIVGMGLNTVAMPRLVYNSNYEFVVWGAVGWEVRTDYFGNTCVFYASELT